jgi:hypothetical protein
MVEVVLLRNEDAVKAVREPGVKLPVMVRINGVQDGGNLKVLHPEK